MEQFDSRKLASGWICVKRDDVSLSDHQQHSELVATLLNISYENINLDLLDIVGICGWRNASPGSH